MLRAYIGVATRNVFKQVIIASGESSEQKLVAVTAKIFCCNSNSFFFFA